MKDESEIFYVLPSELRCSVCVLCPSVVM